MKQQKQVRLNQLLLILYALICVAMAGRGPKTDSMLIERNQKRHNTPGNKMNLQHWVYTDGDGKAYINFNSTLWMRKPPDGTTINFGTFLPKTAGVRVSYDAGICSVLFNSSQQETTLMENKLSINDYYFRNVNWFNQTKPARSTAAGQARELVNCRVDSQVEGGQKGQTESLPCLDTNQQGQQNWGIDDYQTPDWYIVQAKRAIKLWCPARRIMNTFDYLDVKVGIKLHYQVYGFYWLTGLGASKKVRPEQGGYTDVDMPKEVICAKNQTIDECEPFTPKPLHYKGIRIKILDAASGFATIPLTVLSVSAALMLVGIYS